ncbi:MAG TPA: hypothetical protein VJ672_09430 [Gemmatimonadaceae bacterium]|nr:hypothetical protein [Gemmatimonadaceae bacterium]
MSVQEAPRSKWRYLVAVWFAIVGYFAGGMMGVAIAKIVGSLQRCTPADGFPACNFEMYLQVGSLFGLVSLPALIVWRLWQSNAPKRDI